MLSALWYLSSIVTAHACVIFCLSFTRDVWSIVVSSCIRDCKAVSSAADQRRAHPSCSDAEILHRSTRVFFFFLSRSTCPFVFYFPRTFKSPTLKDFTPWCCTWASFLSSIVLTANLFDARSCHIFFLFFCSVIEFSLSSRPYDIKTSSLLRRWTRSGVK